MAEGFGLRTVEMPGNCWAIEMVPAIGAAVVLVGVYSSAAAAELAMPGIAQHMRQSIDS